MELRLRRNNIIKQGKTLFLFDIDATLTPARQPIKEDMIKYLNNLSETHDIAAVGGSDLKKIKEQLEDSFSLFKYVFTENGLVGFKENKIFHEKRINEYLGEAKLKELINYCLHYIADIDIPIKRGTFVEFRTGLINVSPIGRNCSQQERNDFHEFNKERRILENFKSDIENKFGESFGLKFSIGGQISFDIFPKGWDKTYCLQFLNDYDNIFFFGDKTSEGGNDYEIYIDEHVTKGITVIGPEDTMKKITEILSLL